MTKPSKEEILRAKKGLNHLLAHVFIGEDTAYRHHIAVAIDALEDYEKMREENINLKDGVATIYKDIKKIRAERDRYREALEHISKNGVNGDEIIAKQALQTGKAKVYKNCPECKGVGSYPLYDTGSDTTCERCDGTGKEEC